MGRAWSGAKTIVLWLGLGLVLGLKLPCMRVHTKVTSPDIKTDRVTVPSSQLLVGTNNYTNLKPGVSASR